MAITRIHLVFYERDISLPVVSRLPNRFLGTCDFPYFKFEIRDLKAKSGRGLGLKVCTGSWTPKITLGITGLHEILGRENDIEEPY